MDEAGISNGIAFFDVRDGSEITWLNLEGASENWVWLPNGEAIALNLENESVGCQNSKQHGIGIYYWQDKKLEPIQFHPQLMDPISNCEMIIGEIAR
jgi:hypothetical protein